MSAKRDVGFLLKKIRRYLLSGNDKNFLRFRGEVAPRTQPPPNLPEGPHAKLSANYYYTRDARRLVKPNEILVEGQTTLKLPEGGEKPTTVLQRVPGRVNNWDL